MHKRRAFHFRARDKALWLGDRTRLMGIVNVTPDSFYDGGRYLDQDHAVEQALKLVDEGADIIDLGAESSRPGAKPLTVEEELARVIPVLSAIRSQVQVMISIDTYKSVVAETALDHGADIINDISSFRLDPKMPEVAAASEAGIILMNMRGTPESMQKIPPSSSILEEVYSQLAEAVMTADSHKIGRDRIMLDPGIGFGKTVDDNLQILNRLAILEDLGMPVLVGTSRKSFLGKILQLPAGELLWGTAASLAVSIVRGAHVLRVHDVREARMVAAVVDAILAESPVQ